MSLTFCFPNLRSTSYVLILSIFNTLFLGSTLLNLILFGIFLVLLDKIRVTSHQDWRSRQLLDSFSLFDILGFVEFLYCFSFVALLNLCFLKCSFHCLFKLIVLIGSEIQFSTSIIIIKIILL